MIIKDRSHQTLKNDVRRVWNLILVQWGGKRSVHFSQDIKKL